MTPPDPQPLQGVRVLELGSFIAGPFAGQLLADYGAEVLKIEPPTIGDPMRRWGVCIDGRSLWWPSIARGKKSLAIDLHQPEGQALVLRLAKECDVVLENFAPGRLEAWGLGYEELSTVNPGLILVRVSGFGQTGPRALEPGFGSVGEAMGGLRYTTGFADRPPARTGISLGDSLAATFAVIGTLLALYERTSGGLGQVVDVALYESVFAFMESLVADYEVGGVVRGRSGTVLSAVAPSNIYNTLDAVPVLIAANADSVFRRLALATGVIDPDDARFATHEGRSEHMETLDSLVGQWVGSQPFDQVSATLAANRVPFSTINSAEEILADQQFAARNMIQRFQAGFAKPVPMAGVVPRLSRTPGRISQAGPLLGEHTTAVLGDLLKLSETDLAALTEKGVIA